MDYEKKYDELMAKIEAVKKDPKIGLKDGDYYNGYVQKGIRSALDYLLQEESENERIRKHIVTFIMEADRRGEAPEECAKWLAYLEKQKDEAQKQFNLGMQAGKEEAMYEMQKEQKPTPIFKIGDVVCDTNHYRRPVYRIVSVGSECYICESDDKSLGDRAVVHFALDNPYLRLVERKSAEWSEEDEKLLDFWLDVIDRNDWRMDEKFCKASREFINRLKSLRPQPHWRPSEKEIEALSWVINYLTDIEPGRASTLALLKFNIKSL